MNPRGKRLEARALRAQAERLLDQAARLEADANERVVKVVFVHRGLNSPLFKRSTYDYLDDTAFGLTVGDRVWASVANGFGAHRVTDAVVVEVNAERSFRGALKSITDEDLA